MFAIKASRYLTHIKRLSRAGEGTARPAERLEPLLETPKMGPLLWQLPESFHRDDERLAEALDQLPAGGATASSSATRAGSKRRYTSCFASIGSRW